MEIVCALGGLTLFLRATTELIGDSNAFDDKHPVLEHDVALRLSGQLASAGVDPARFQRAAQCPRQSTGGRGDDIVERGRMIGILPRYRPIVLSYF